MGESARVSKIIPSVMLGLANEWPIMSVANTLPIIISRSSPVSLVCMLVSARAMWFCWREMRP